MMTSRRATPLICGCVLGLISVAPGFGKGFQDARSFYANFDTEYGIPRGRNTAEKKDFFASAPDAEIGKLGASMGAAGQPLSTNAVRLWADVQAGAIGQLATLLPLGTPDSAVRFDGTGKVSSAQGAITFWFKGQGWDYESVADWTQALPKRVNLRSWDIQTPLRETFFELRGGAGKVSFGKTAPGTLALEPSTGPALTVPVNFDVSQLHFVTINYEGGKATVLIDGEPKASGAFVMPTNIQDIVIGHVGPGGATWNRWLDDFAVWKRPLKPAEIMLLWRKEGMIQLPLQVAIPRIAAPPVIDGIVRTGEWDRAAQVAGMVGIRSFIGVDADYGMEGDLSDLKDTISLAYDDKNLYVAYHCPPPREIVGMPAMIAVMLKSACTMFDANVDFDDAFSMVLQYPKPGGDYYRTYVNKGNTHYEYSDKGSIEGCRLTGGWRNLKWDPKWITASTLDNDGWHLEIAMPLDAFDVPAPKTGDVWYMNFMRCWWTIRGGKQSWAWGNRSPNDEGNELRASPAGRVVFAGPGVVARQQSIGEIGQGKPRLVTELVNTDTRPRTVRCVLETNSGELKDEKSFTIPAGGRTTYEFAGRIVEDRTAAVTLKVLDETGVALMLSGYPVLRPTVADVYVRKYPTQERMRYEVEFVNHARYEARTIAAKVTVKNAKGKTVWAKTYKDFTDYNLIAEFSTKDLPFGTYNVDFTFTAKGRTLETATQTFDKKPLPAWYGNTLGLDGEDAPYPWSNIVCTNDQVTVWGRTYDFGKTLYPQAVLTQGKTMLRAPMGVVLETDEGVFKADATANDVKWTKVTHSRVEGVRSLKCGRLTLENRFWIEYDGMVWSTLRLIPDGKVNVKSLAFEIPCTPEFSDVINTCDSAMRYTGKLKPEGYVGTPRSTWLGNGVGGMQWTTETVGSFRVREPEASLSVTNTPAGGLLRVTFIDIPTEMTAPHEIPFGFVATPVRPKVLRTWAGCVFRHYLNAIERWQDPEPFWVPFQDHWLDKTAPQRGRLHGAYLPGIEVRNVHHTTLMLMGNNDAAMQEFGDEWLVGEDTRWRGKYAAGLANVPVTTASKSLQDYIAWRFNEYFKQQPMPGAYFDVSDPWFSRNPNAGAGYRREDGTYAPSLSLLGHRQVLKRIYNIQNAVYPGGGLWFHASSGPQPTYMSYCVGDYDGENYNSAINVDNPTYRHLLTPATYRAQYMGSNWGYWNAFLSQGRITMETLRKYGFSELWDQWTGLQWLHDCYIGTGWFGQLGALEPLLSQRELVPFNKYHLFSPCNRFIPYWEQTVTKLDQPEFYASFYVKERITLGSHWALTGLAFYSDYESGLDDIHQAVVVFYNQGEYAGPVRLKLDWAQLGFGPNGQDVKAINAVHSTGFRVKDWEAVKKEGELFDNSAAEYARIENGELVFPISAYNYRMIVLQAPKPWAGPSRE